MADTLVTDETAKTTIVATDELYINDVAGGNLDKKAGLDDIKTYMSLSPTLVTPALGTIASGDITAGTGYKITFTDVVPCVLEVPEGTVAFPDVHALATQTSKITGIVLPDGAAVSELNFKCKVPKDLASTPAMKIRVRIMTQGAVAGPNDIRLTVSTVGIADTEDLDVAFTVETETTVVMPTATETLDYYIQDLTTDWAADDTITGQIARDPTDAADDFTDDVLIYGIELLVDRTI